ncbi:hypothetical protein BVC80_1459g19 [Macleaya cordata]|uniref:Uncharacterized protein n=1 Tax=Macleaya cordata TaxID=56857 RepID=A0A200PPI4_MACCD|nr:hypothetical protein BVC80_1459g19 [Macleaya cordata]
MFLDVNQIKDAEMEEWNNWEGHDLLILRGLSNNYSGFSGLASDPSSSKDGMKAESHSASSTITGVRVVLICLGLVAAVALSVFLFKMWQKKKREEQHARLLRLFEEDDELELELGLRD